MHPEIHTVTTHGTFENVLGDAAPPVRTLAEAVRALVAEVYPGVTEVPWPKQRIAGFGVGPKKLTEHFCYVSVCKDSVNLGFNQGAELPDPEGLLEGNGKLYRHVKIRTLEEVRNPALRRLVAEAVLLLGEPVKGRAPRRES